MSVWLTKPIDPESKLSSLALIIVAVLVVGLALWDGPLSGTRTANQLEAFVGASSSPAPFPVQDTLFTEPQLIEWDGYIRRIFISGEGLEIVSPAAPGGVFQAFMASGEISPVTEGAVSIQGLWRGWTCAYGGVQKHCVPDVQIRSIHVRPVELE
jgi:hypothetical protein